MHALGMLLILTIHFLIFRAVVLISDCIPPGMRCEAIEASERCKVPMIGKSKASRLIPLSAKDAGDVTMDSPELAFNSFNKMIERVGWRY